MVRFSATHKSVIWQLPLMPTQVTPFHSSRPPTITVKSYLEDRCESFLLRVIIMLAYIVTRSMCAVRILKYAGCSEETCILALIYMDQAKNKLPWPHSCISEPESPAGCAIQPRVHHIIPECSSTPGETSCSCRMAAVKRRQVTSFCHAHRRSRQ